MKPRDALDRRILAYLEEDARISATELARRLGIARSTVNERIARLERDGVIIGYSAIIRPDPSEIVTSAMLFLQCERRKVSQITHALRGFPEIRNCSSVSGRYDLACHAITPSTDDLDALIDEIATLGGVNTLDTTIILATKFTHASSGVLGPVQGRDELNPMLRVV